MTDWAALFRFLSSDNVDNVDNEDQTKNVERILPPSPSHIVNIVNIVKGSKKQNEQEAVAPLSPLAKAFSVLERHRPDHVGAADWQRAVESGRRFLVQWGEAAEALGWTMDDLFGLHDPPQHPHPNYRRLSRLDATGLVWLLRSRTVTTLTEHTATIETKSGGHLTFYRRSAPCHA
jgi:hypothetical protein